MGENHYIYVILYVIVFATHKDLVLSKASKIQMRIVHDTTNYGYYGSVVDEMDSHPRLVARAKPSNFSGPILMKRLLGQCFNTTLEKYQYIFCPFHNMTQHEVSQRWNAYQGVLGIWSHWHITNNSFSSMQMTYGDKCGDTDRSAQVVFKCASEEKLLNVTEPERCKYLALFATRYVCHRDAMLVYPRLSKTFQKTWDHLWTEYKQGYLTEKGYNISLEKMFNDVGFTKGIVISDTKDEARTSETSKTSSGTFADLSTCNKEYEDLKKEIVQLSGEIESLKLMLDLTKVRSRTHKEQSAI